MSKKPQIQTRKPPAATAASLEAFVVGAEEEAAQASKPLQSTKATRKGSEQLRRVTLYFPAELHKRARIAAINAGVPLSSLVVDSLERALKQKPRDS